SGVRPSICRAKCPTAHPPDSSRLALRDTATTDGSSSTTPSPGSATRVAAVPKSTAKSACSSVERRGSILAHYCKRQNYKIENSGRSIDPLIPFKTNAGDCAGDQIACGTLASCGTFTLSPYDFISKNKNRQPSVMNTNANI